MKKTILALMLFCLPAFAIKPLTTDILSAQSMGASFSSKGIDASKVELMSIQAVWSGGGAPTGTFIVQVSNDDVAEGSVDQASNVVNWSTYPSSAISITTDGDLSYNLANFGYRWVRINYTRTSGTGTINAKLLLKAEK